MDWRKIKAGLPPRRTDVLIVIRMPEGPSVDTGFLIKEDWYYTGGVQKIGAPVTHWAFMPEPPEEKMEQVDA